MQNEIINNKQMHNKQKYIFHSVENPIQRLFLTEFKYLIPICKLEGLFFTYPVVKIH